MATRVKGIFSLETIRHGLRSAIETLMLGGGVVFTLTTSTVYLRPGILETALFAIFAVSILYYFVRLRLIDGALPIQAVYEVLYSGVLGGLCIGLLFVFSVWRVPRELLLLDWEQFSERFMLSAAIYFDDLSPAQRAAELRDFEFSLIDALGQFALLFSISTMLIVRLGKRVWLRWKALREQYLIWELTHTHLVLVVVALILLLFFLSVYTINQTLSLLAADEISTVLVIIATLVFTYLSGAIVGLVAVVAILAPAALLSYWLSRPIVERLATLTHITNALSHGNYTTRLTITGQDEVSRLQTNFNSMATTLQETLIALQAEHDMLHHLLNSRRMLFTNLSHELRTPLATMRGYLESLQGRGDTLPPELLHDLDIMHRETLHLQRLVDDFLLLTRAEEVDPALNPEPMDIQPILERLAEAMAPNAWHSKKVTIKADLTRHVPLAVVDELRLEQIIHNLVQNAVRHTPAGGNVTLTAERSGPNVVIQVIDTGSGIAPDDLPHIWQRFFRAQSQSQQQSRGAGLGLALVKELTEAMHGRVAVESTPGKGSRFMIWLPQAPQPHAPQPIESIRGHNL